MSKNKNQKNEHDIDISKAIESAKQDLENKFKEERSKAVENDEVIEKFKKEEESIKEKGFKVKVRDGHLRDKSTISKSSTNYSERDHEYISTSKKEEDIANKGDRVSLASLMSRFKK